MILPIVAFGTAVLKKKAKDVEKDHPGFTELLENMWETMYNANGVGLAAPQIGKQLRIFIVDTIQLEEEEGDMKDGIKKAFINAEILEEEGEPWLYEEGCLSIPHIRGDVERQPEITIRYQDENFEEHTKIFDGMNARVIQHEYDHIEGVLFTTKLKPLKRRLIKRKLESIRKGSVKVDYRMKFPG